MRACLGCPHACPPAAGLRALAVRHLLARGTLLTHASLLSSPSLSSPPCSCGCDDSDYCIRCSNPDWVVGSTGRCVPPPPTGQCSYDMHSWCKRCNSGGRCTRCAKRNHVLDRRNGRCRPAQCRERHPRCSLCSYGGACLRCQRGWFWSKKTHKCVAVPRTHLKRRWTCRTLDPNCARCMRNAPLQCKECRAGYGKFWRGSKCMNAGWFQRWRKQHG